MASAAAGNVPTFGELLGKLKKVNPKIGMVEDDCFYDFNGLSEEQKFDWTSSLLRFTVCKYMADTNCTHANMFKIQHTLLCFNHQLFVKKLVGILSATAIFKYMHECLYS